MPFLAIHLKSERISPFWVGGYAPFYANAYRNQKYGTLEPLIKARKDVYYRFMENQDVDWRKSLWSISVQLWNFATKMRL